MSAPQWNGESPFRNPFEDPAGGTPTSSTVDLSTRTSTDSEADPLTSRAQEAQSIEEEDEDIISPLPFLLGRTLGNKKGPRKTVSFADSFSTPSASEVARKPYQTNPFETPANPARKSSFSGNSFQSNPFQSSTSSIRTSVEVDPSDSSSSRNTDRTSERSSSEIAHDTRSSRPLTGRQSSFADILQGNGFTSGRRRSSTVAPDVQVPRRQSIPRRLSSFNPFDKAFIRARQSSNVNPNDVSQLNATLDDDGDVLTPLPRAHLRSMSTSAASGSRFRNPFSSGETINNPHRRPSMPMERRPSSFQRMMSIVSEENPIPQRYRSNSVSSLSFYISPLTSTNTTLPIFEDDIEAQKENVQEYLAGVERLQASKKRKPWESHGFQGTYFFIVLAVVYFIFIGRPIWPGVATVYYRWIRSAHLGNLGVIVFLGWSAFQAFLPLLVRFEQEVDDVEKRDASETALIIPAYKAAGALPETIIAALKIFKPEQIFIVNNANTPEPPDNTAEVCAKYQVNHAYVPIGSKIVAEFVGVALTKKYKYIMLIDDDVHLPANLPLVTDRIVGKTKCIGYTIKSTGANGARGTIIQQCQDMEYKSSGLTRTFSGKYGSATFPHGAIILWERECLQDLFNVHPGYTISEDWYFGHAARSSGCRIEFCSQVFVETETPPNFIRTGVSNRGGFGEMTVYKQRFGRWNYFFVFRCWEDSIYILFSWRLGWREIVTKIFVLVEVYDSVMAFLRPFVIIITLIAAWRLFLTFTAVTMGMYILAFGIFNEHHLRRKGERVSWKILPTYMGMKFTLLWVNSQSVYYGLYDYARFFKVRHSRVIENKSALEAAYEVRLGTRLVPLDTKIGGAVQEAEPDAITFAAGSPFDTDAEKKASVGVVGEDPDSGDEKEQLLGGDASEELATAANSMEIVDSDATTVFAASSSTIVHSWKGRLEC